MTVHHPIFCSLLYLALVTQADTCAAGWFGDLCNFRCRCETHPCKANGVCEVKEDCNPGWFYYACQFRDLLFHYKDRLTDAVLTDYNAFTCLKESSSTTEVRIGLTTFVHFFWIRLIVSEKAGKKARMLELAFNDSREPCIHGRRYRFSMRVIDFECDLEGPINVVLVRGEAAGYLCDVFISGGQNLALLQDTFMSSVGTDPLNQKFKSSLAVDGSLLATDRCARTDGIQTYNQSFTLVFLTPVRLQNIIINTSPRFQDSLDGFVLMTLDNDNKVIEHYKDPGVSSQRYSVMLNETTAIVARIVVIVNVSHGAMEICELEAYGERVCATDHYGFTCSSACDCPGYTCARHSGECLLSCFTGYYGSTCRLSCSDHCYPPGVCDVNNGSCYNCAVGYSGDRCEQACVAGTYGVGCVATCPSTCKNSACDPSTGFCESCPLGYYGSICNNSCPEKCLDKLCDPTGQCFNCTPGFYDEVCSSPCSPACLGKGCNATDGQCIECIDGYHGLRCSSMCPVHCSDKICDKFSGSCSSCEPGYFDEDCSLPCLGNCTGGTCDILNGSCSQGCADGYFGSTCSSECPPVCKNKRCDQITGLCVACNNSYGTYCSISCPTVCANNTCGRYTGNCLFCGKGLYGYHCAHKCPENCANNRCHVKNGNCTACIAGYHGKFCDKKCPMDCLQPTCDIRTAQCVKAGVTDSEAYIYVIVASLASFLVTAVMLLYKKRWRQKSGDDEEEGEEDDDMSSTESLSLRDTEQVHTKPAEIPKPPTVIDVKPSQIAMDKTTEVTQPKVQGTELKVQASQLKVQASQLKVQASQLEV